MTPAHTLEQHPKKPDLYRYTRDGEPLSAWTTKEKARRIMACIRACADIPTEKLEQLALAKILFPQ